MPPAWHTVVIEYASSPMTNFFVRFIVILISLFLLLDVNIYAQQYLIAPFTHALAVISSTLIQMVDADVIAYEKVIQNTVNGFAVEIQPGCNGVEAVLILTAAILAFPAPWSWKLKGLGVGFIAIQALNLVRIISLFYMGQWNETLFKWFHLFLWQALIILDALVVWILWLKWMPDASDGVDSGPPASLVDSSVNAQ